MRPSMKQISAKHLAHNRNQRRDQHRQDQRHVQPQQHRQQCPPEPTQLLIQKEPHLHWQQSMKHLIIKKNRWHNQRYPDRPGRTKFVLFCHCTCISTFRTRKIFSIFLVAGIHRQVFDGPWIP